MSKKDKELNVKVNWHKLIGLGVGLLVGAGLAYKIVAMLR